MSEDLELVAKVGSIQYYQSKWKWRQTPLTETAITTIPTMEDRNTLYSRASIVSLVWVKMTTTPSYPLTSHLTEMGAQYCLLQGP